MSTALVETRGLKVHFPIRKSLFGAPGAMLRAVDDVSLSIAAGEVLGLVGESGSGKSTLGRAVMALERPTAGQVLFDSVDLASLDATALKPYRKRMQMVFQDPFSSLNPRMTVEESLALPLRFMAPDLGRAARRQRVEAALQRVGLGSSAVTRYPHEFSGGQRQRIGIARALIVEPDFIMADEPVSALDVSVQAQVLNLFARIQREMRLALLFVTHDLAVVGHVADRVAVMYLGRIVEIAETRQLFQQPRHPYTEALLSAAPDPVPGQGRARIRLEGEMPSPLSPPSGCPFRTRCRYAQTACAEIRPELQRLDGGHEVACLRNDLELTGALPAATLEERSRS